MKTIYVVTLDDEIPLSSRLIDDIKLLCFLVYDEIMGIEYDNGNKILCHDGIIYNELLEREDNGIYTHRFRYNDILSGKYEPFMINDTSFAFTVYDGMLSNDDIINIISKVRIYTKIRCNFKVSSVTYKEDSKNKNRMLAIKKLLESNHNDKEDKKNKVKIKSILPMIGLTLR